MPIRFNKTDLYMVWGLPGYVFFLGLGLWVAGFIPFHEPSWGAEEVARIVNQDTFGIRFGSVMMMLAAGISLFYAAVFCKIVSDVEGGPGSWTYLAIMTGLGNAIVTFYPPYAWVTATFRPERSPELIMLMNDYAWLQFTSAVLLWIAWPGCAAFVAFSDKNENKWLPRWFGYFTLWCIVLGLPTQMVFFFYDGPFAWDGLVAFWMPLVVFGTWLTMVSVLVYKSMSRRLLLEQ